MLLRASVSDVRSGKVTKDDGELVVAMRVYPRFLPKARVSEYVPALSPAAELFARYRELKRESGDQNAAFQGAGYEQRFELDDAGMGELARLAEMARERDVYLVCQCEAREMCHVDLMLLIAEKRFSARIGPLAYGYPEFRKRLG